MNDHSLFITEQARLDMLFQHIVRDDQMPPGLPVFVKAAVLAGSAAAAAAQWNVQMTDATFSGVWILL